MGNLGPKLKSLFGQFGTQAKAKVLLFLSVRVLFIFTFLRGIQEFQTILHSVQILELSFECYFLGSILTD